MEVSKNKYEDFQTPQIRKMTPLMCDVAQFKFSLEEF